MVKKKNEGVLIIENYLPDLYSSRIPLGKYLSDESYTVYYACPGRHEHLQLLLKNRSKFSVYETIINIINLLCFVRKNRIRYILSFRHHSNIYAIIIYFLKRKIIVYPTITGLGNAYNKSENVINKSSLLTFVYKVFSKRGKIVVQNSDIPLRLKVDNYILVNGSGVGDPSNCISDTENHLKFVYAGRLLRSKGVMDAAEMVAKLFRMGKAVEFKVFGEVDPENSASLSMEELKYLRSLPFVKIHGHVEDKEHIFRDSNIAILLSDYNEGLSRFLIEALAYKLVIVTVNRPGCRELAMHGNGVCISNEDEFINFFEEPFNLVELRRKSYDAFKTFYEDVKIYNSYKELLSE